LPRHVALLRGINVGGKNKLPMKDLVALFEAAGCKNVATYIQSGNVLFDATAAVAKRIPAVIAQAIEETFGLRVPVVTRSAAELAAVAVNHPFASRDLAKVHVMFLQAMPTPAVIADLDPERSPGDTFYVHGREIYLHLPNGVARTKLSNDYFDRQLQTVSTQRNWNTLLKLIELAGGD
jgi:uncharacterized protein (DUF1697 family)